MGGRKVSEAGGARAKSNSTCPSPARLCGVQHTRRVQQRRAQHSTAQHSAAQHSTAQQRSTVQHSTACCRSLARPPARTPTLSRWKAFCRPALSSRSEKAQVTRKRSCPWLGFHRSHWRSMPPSSLKQSCGRGGGWGHAGRGAGKGTGGGEQQHCPQCIKAGSICRCFQHCQEMRVQ